MSKTTVLIAALVISTMAAAPARKPATGTPTAKATRLRLASASFESMGEIPAKHTCDGGDLSPPLAWSGAPKGTKSFALIVTDPDAPDPAAPKMTWTHWVLFDLPPTASGLPEAVRALPEGTRPGVNDWRQTAYRGPCPPIGSHRYFHRLYALDTTFTRLTRPTRTVLEKAMRGHVLAETALIGVYRKR
jgi:hypothetical protein